MRWRAGLVIAALLGLVTFGAHLLQEHKRQQLKLCQQGCNERFSECLVSACDSSKSVCCETHHFACNVGCGAQ